MPDQLAADVQQILTELLDATKASRTTFRVDLPERGVSVAIPLAEALGPGVGTMMTDGSLDQRGAATAQWVDKHRKPLIQEDLENADPKPPRALLDKYGAKAQMLAPVEEKGALIGWVSVHHLPGPRPWSTADVAALEDAAARISVLLKGRN